MASSALTKAEAKLSQLRARMAATREEYADTIAEGIGVAVAIGSGLAFGAAEEKWGEDAIMGASIPLVVGAPATVLAMAGFGGPMRGALLEAGKAGLAIEGYKGGIRFARDWMADDEETAEGAAAERRG